MSLQTDDNMVEAGNVVNNVIRDVALRCRAISAVFCAIVIVLLGANAINSRLNNPLDAPRLGQMIIDLNRNPTDDHLRASVRRIDQRLRTNFVRTTAFAQTGYILLIAGIVVFVLSDERARSTRAQAAPSSGTVTRSAPAPATLSRTGIAAASVLFGGLLLTLCVLSRHDVTAAYERVGLNWHPAASGYIPPCPTTPTPAITGQTATSSFAPAPAGAQQPSSAPAQATGGSLSTDVANLSPLPVMPTSAPGSPQARIAGRTAASALSVHLSPYCPKAWQDQWPAFRGPGSDAVAPDGPQLSSLKTLWQVPVPLPGWNSPIAFGNEIFLSGADAQHRAVYCFSATDGKLLWSKPAPALAAAPKQLSDDTGHAPSTMATDGLHVATIFINGDVYCFDRTGKQLWARNLGVPDNTYGHASSLQVYGSGLIVQMDQGADPTENKSTLSALDFATGKTVWQVKRPVQGSWSTPMIVHAGNADQLVTCATPWTIAYDPRNGKELWRANFLSGDVAPSPTFGGGYVYACNQGATLDAIRPGLSGNITTTGVAWSSTDGLPDIASPLDAGEIVFLASSEGALTAVDARTGKKLWEHDYDDGIKSSPLLVGTDVWVIDMTGTIHAIEPGPTFHETAKLALKETCDATPALLGNKVFIRTADHLICLAAPSAGQTQ